MEKEEKEGSGMKGEEERRKKEGSPMKRKGRKEEGNRR